MARDKPRDEHNRKPLKGANIQTIKRRAARRNYNMGLRRIRPEWRRGHDESPDGQPSVA